MKIKTTNREKIREYPYGMYVWQTPEGEILGDDLGNVMNVFCEEGNVEAIKALADAARFYGEPRGNAVFWAGKRPISDEEHAIQKDREAAGLVPDPFDMRAIHDDEEELGIKRDW